MRKVRPSSSGQGDFFFVLLYPVIETRSSASQAATRAVHNSVFTLLCKRLVLPLFLDLG